MQFLFANNANTTLAGSINTTATALTVSSGAGSLFPSPTSGQGFAVTLVDAATGLLNEIMYCTSRTGDVLTVTRAQEGTSAQNWSAGDLVNNFVTAGTAQSFAQATSIQNNSYNYAADTGTANAYIVLLSPTQSAPVIGALIHFTAANANTGASTLTVDSETAYPILGIGLGALTGGEIQAGSFCIAEWNATLSSYVLLQATGGYQQINPLRGSGTIARQLQYKLAEAFSVEDVGGVADGQTDIYSNIVAAFAASKNIKLGNIGNSYGVRACTVTAGGNSYATAPTVTFSAAPAGGVTATGIALVTAGVVTAVLVTHPGSGYTTAPTISFTPTSGGTGAAATCSLAVVYSCKSQLAMGAHQSLDLNGAILNFSGATFGVDSVTIPQAGYGTGYVTAPTVTFSAPVSGVTATGHAVLTGTTVTNVIVDNPGSGYTTAPTITFTPTSGGTGAYAYAILQACITITPSNEYRSPSPVRNGYIVGSSNSLSYGGSGIKVASPYQNFPNLGISGCCAGVTYGANAYCVDFSYGYFTGNFIDVNADCFNVTSAGERLSFTGCTHGGSQHKNYTRFAEVSFYNCSWDYPINGGDYVLDNIQFNGGVPSGLLRIVGGHWESTKAAVGNTVPRVTNNGLLVLDGPYIWDDNSAGDLVLIANNGHIYARNVAGRWVDGFNFVITGTGTVSWCTPAEGTYNCSQRINEARAGVNNTGFRTGTIAGWSNTGVAGTTVSTSSPPAGSADYALLKSSGSGTDILSSSAMPIQPGAAVLIASVIRQNYNAFNTTWLIQFYDAAGTHLTGDISNSVSTVDGAWVLWQTGRQGIPAGAAYCISKFTLAADASQPTFGMTELVMTAF